MILLRGTAFGYFYMTENKEFPEFSFPGAAQLAQKFIEQSRGVLNAVRDEARLNDDHEVIECFPDLEVLHAIWREDQSDFRSSQEDLGKEIVKFDCVALFAFALAVAVGLLFTWSIGAILIGFSLLFAAAAWCSARAKREGLKEGCSRRFEHRVLDVSCKHMLIGEKAVYLVYDHHVRNGFFGAKTVFFDAIGTVRVREEKGYAALEISNRSGQLIASIPEPVSQDLGKLQLRESIARRVRENSPFKTMVADLDDGGMCNG